MAEHPLTSDASRPWSVYAATGRYKKATKQLSRFINENGGDTSKIAGWEWAPHDVLDFTGGVIPADVWMALKEAIAEREYVAHHYDNIRIRDGGDYTNADIGHLRFVELLKIIRTVWSTYVDDEVSCVDEPEGVTNLDMLVRNACRDCHGVPANAVSSLYNISMMKIWLALLQTLAQVYELSTECRL